MRLRAHPPTHCVSDALAALCARMFDHRTRGAGSWATAHAAGIHGCHLAYALQFNAPLSPAMHAAPPFPHPGIAGIIKACLTLHHGVIPRSLHYGTPNEHVDFASLNIAVAAEQLELPNSGSEAAPPIVGVSSFGELYFMYRYISRESCSQFDSLPLTYLTIPGGVFEEALEHVAAPYAVAVAVSAGSAAASAAAGAQCVGEALRGAMALLRTPLEHAAPDARARAMRAVDALLDAVDAMPVSVRATSGVARFGAALRTEAKLLQLHE